MIAREAPADVDDVFWPPPIVMPEDEFTTAARSTSLEGGEEHGGNHGAQPYVHGWRRFVILMLLLWITTRFNRDR
ncbi:hypothetical protein [Streptomyces sp. DHE17-7]|uniref:hypothetical protein n=1 Tax=Streptomyces sp. DHE17-7 TaxID=2759949 RepID=UPI0022EB12AC|nr:hypothetical protein [Streptomyces sp. DHE17-7]MBJ6619565.1 hypothetical protein [Streptomyces sp. DHE17-7]